MRKKWLVIASAIAGGLLLNYLKLPAGALVGSMLGTGAAQLMTTTKLEVPPLIKRSTRVIMGCYLGLGITAGGIHELRTISGAVAIITLGMTVITLFVAFLLLKYCKWKLADAILGSLPAGLSEIGMNAEDFRADSIALTTVHLMRLITILTFIPLIIKVLQ